MFGPMTGSSNLRASIDQYAVELEKQVYLPGEVVRGNVTLTTNKPIDCRGVRLKLEGVSHCRFETGSGDNREVHIAVRYYARVASTIWGHLHKTPIIDEAGDQVYFGPPWAPDEGVLRIPMSEEDERKGVIIRCMDYDPGVRDDLLGEVHVDPNIFIVQHANSPGMCGTLPLRFKGKERGNITFSAHWEDAVATHSASATAYSDSSGQHGTHRLLCLRIANAKELRKADFIGRNDVYVQAYIPSEHIDGSEKALPPPAKTMTLPPGTLHVPFQFQLPADLPSSAEIMASNYCRYSVHSHIDIKWRLDPSTRLCFTVVQPLQSALYSAPSLLSAEQDKRIHPRCPACIPFCCCSLPFPCITLGTAKLQAQADRSGCAPGEALFLYCRADNSSTKTATLTAMLHLIGTLTADNRTHQFDLPYYSIGEWQVPPGPFDVTGHRYIMPSVPATFNAGAYMFHKVRWQSGAPRKPGSWQEAARLRRMAIHPIVWRYEIVVRMQIQDCLWPCYNTTLEKRIPFVVTGVPLSAFPGVGAPVDASTPLVAQPIVGVEEVKVAELDPTPQPPAYAPTDGDPTAGDGNEYEDPNTDPAAGQSAAWTSAAGFDLPPLYESLYQNTQPAENGATTIVSAQINMATASKEDANHFGDTTFTPQYFCAAAPPPTQPPPSYPGLPSSSTSPP